MKGKKQGNSVMTGFVISLMFFLFGIFVLIPLFAPFGVLWCAIMGSVMGAMKKKLAERRDTDRRAQSEREEPGRSGSTKSREHGHSPVSYSYDRCALEKRMEQLDVLKGAGLLDEVEYQQRREDILSMSGSRR